jgi:hypothetical protein
VGPRAGLDAIKKRTYFAPAGNRTLVAQPVGTANELSRLHLTVIKCFNAAFLYVCVCIYVTAPLSVVGRGPENQNILAPEITKWRF